MQTYYIYFMACKNGKALYVGVTNNLEKRVIEHRTYDPKSFTSRYNCHKLVYYEEYSSIQEAIAREKQIKSWKRWRKDQSSIDCHVALRAPRNDIQYTRG